MRDFINQTNIKSIEITEDTMEMMDIEVDEVQSFYANGVLVHNCSQEMCLSQMSVVITNFGEMTLLEASKLESVSVLTPWGFKRLYDYRTTKGLRKRSV